MDNTFSKEELRNIIKHVKLEHPELIEDDSLESRFRTFEQSLEDNNVNTHDDIDSLILCSELVLGERQYFGELEGKYLELTQIKEAQYREAQAAIILSAKNVSQGEVKAKARNLEIKASFITTTGMHKRITNHVFYLKGRSDVLAQRLSHAKQMFYFDKHITK
jgi:hypothetical protein